MASRIDWPGEYDEPAWVEPMLPLLPRNMPKGPSGTVTVFRSKLYPDRFLALLGNGEVWERTPGGRWKSDPVMMRLGLPFASMLRFLRESQVLEEIG